MPGENPAVTPVLPFRPAPWLPGPHAQTLFGALCRRIRLPFRREALGTPDGDELVLDHLDPPGEPPPARLLVLHGLEGSSYSASVGSLLVAAWRRGLAATALNFRSCARDPLDRRRSLPNRRPRLYHSGETSDLGFVVETLATREPSTPLLLAGVSLGGNVLMKWLGENPGQRSVRAAAAISVPFDLAAGARHLETPLGRLYVRSFVRTLASKAERIASRFPRAAARIDLARARRANTFFEFDDAATAPLHGFAGAEDYWERSSSLRFLGSVATPALCLGAEDDPFLPAEALHRAARAASPSVTVVAEGTGGHCGFWTGTTPFTARSHAAETAVSWLSDRLA